MRTTWLQILGLCHRLHQHHVPTRCPALGWDTHGPTSAPTRLEHSGSLFTFTSEQALWPGTGYGVVLLFDSGSPMMLDQRFRGITCSRLACSGAAGVRHLR